jgi:hypothetical protein
MITAALGGLEILRRALLVIYFSSGCLLSVRLEARFVRPLVRFHLRIAFAVVKPSATE